MSNPKRWGALAVVAVAIAALFIWWRWPAPGASTDVRVTVVAERDSIGPFGRIALRAEVEPSAGDFEYAWTASGGHVVGKNAAPQWVAPGEQGRYTVDLTLRDRRSGREHVAAIELGVVRYRGMYDENGQDSAGSPEALDTDYSIGAVTFDKAKMCANDDVLISIEAADPSGRPDWVMPVVQFPGATFNGFETVARVGASYLDAPVPISEIQVELIDTRTRARVAARTVPFVIEDCKDEQAGLKVRCNVSQSRVDEVLCQASVPDPAAFQPVRYEWTVADEDPVPTEQAWLRTRLPARLELGAIQSYVIVARAYDASGRHLQGRTAYVDHNTLWETAEMTGLMQLAVHFTSPPLERDGSYVTHVEIFNPFPETVHFDAVQVARFRCGDAGEDVEPSEDAPLAPAAIVGADQLAPGASVAFDWRLPIDPARCSAHATLRGEGAESGRPAEAVWIMPSDARTRTALGGAERDRVMKAMQILSARRGAPVHTIDDADLADLEREGLIDPLPPAPDDGRVLEPGQHR